MAKPDFITEVLRKGGERAKEVAEATMSDVRRAIFGG